MFGYVSANRQLVRRRIEEWVMDLEFQLKRVTQAERDIKAANAQIAEVQAAALKLGLAGQDVTAIAHNLRRCHAVVQRWSHDKDQLTLMISKALLRPRR